jgi:hypothetical protein
MILSKSSELNFLSSTGDVAVNGVMAFQDFAVERGYLDEVVQPEQFMDDSFLTAARELLGEDG